MVDATKVVLDTVRDVPQEETGINPEKSPFFLQANCLLGAPRRANNNSCSKMVDALLAYTTQHRTRIRPYVLVRGGGGGDGRSGITVAKKGDEGGTFFYDAGVGEQLLLLEEVTGASLFGNLDHSFLLTRARAPSAQKKYTSALLC